MAYWQRVGLSASSSTIRGRGFESRLGSFRISNQYTHFPSPSLETGWGMLWEKFFPPVKNVDFPTNTPLGLIVPSPMASPCHQPCTTLWEENIFPRHFLCHCEGT